MLDKIFSALPGSWQLERTISSGENFLGRADFTPAKLGLLRLKELGSLKLLNGETLQSGRSWLWQWDSDSTLKIFYDENPQRLYHAIEFTHQNECLMGNGTHLCGQDQYTGEYALTENTMIIKQMIFGPAKNLQVTSTFSRA